RAENLLMFLIKLLVMKWTEVRAQQKKRFTADPHCFRIFEHLSPVFSLNKQGTANVNGRITAFGEQLAYMYMLENRIEAPDEKGVTEKKTDITHPLKASLILLRGV